jgi:hypothetical protein
LDSYFKILEEFGVEQDKEAIAILEHMRFVHPVPSEDTYRILIGMLRLNFGVPSNMRKIMKEFCPNDPELDEEYQSTANKVAGYLKKLIRKGEEDGI